MCCGIMAVGAWWRPIHLYSNGRVTVSNPPTLALFDDRSQFTEIVGFRALRELDSHISLRVDARNSPGFVDVYIHRGTLLRCLSLAFDYPNRHFVGRYGNPPTFSYVMECRTPVAPLPNVLLGPGEVLIDRYRMAFLVDANSVDLHLGSAAGWYTLGHIRQYHLETTLKAMNEPTQFALVATVSPNTNRLTRVRLEWLGLS